MPPVVRLQVLVSGLMVSYSTTHELEFGYRIDSMHWEDDDRIQSFLAQSGVLEIWPNAKQHAGSIAVAIDTTAPEGYVVVRSKFCELPVGMPVMPTDLRRMLGKAAKVIIEPAHQPAGVRR